MIVENNLTVNNDLTVNNNVSFEKGFWSKSGGNGQVDGSLSVRGALNTDTMLTATNGKIGGILRVARGDTDNFPSGWGGGVIAWDVYANGSIAVGHGTTAAAYLTKNANNVGQICLRKSNGSYKCKTGDDF
jgi:hypothetical protein